MNMDQMTPDKMDELWNVDYYKSLKGKEALAERLRGRLPMIDIAGKPFFVHMHFGILSSRDNLLAGPIQINDLEMDPVSKKLHFYYHVPSMTRVTFPDNIKEFPKDVVGVEIPNRYFLDPVAMARLNDKPIGYYGVPLRMYRKARIIPLQKTELATLISRNNNQRPFTRPVTPAKKIQQRKRGIGL